MRSVFGESLVVRIDENERSMRIKAEPETFYITDHYLNYPWILVRIASVDLADLRELLEDAWRLSAPKRLVSDYDKERATIARTRGADPTDT